MVLNRTSRARYRAKHLSRSRTGAAGGRRADESRAVRRLVICGVIFVLLVAVKLLFPQAVGQLARSAGRLIGRDADFKEAFAAMGRAISGEEAVSDSLQDAYTAVFNPSGMTADGGEDAAPIRAGGADCLEPWAGLAGYAVQKLPCPTQPAVRETVLAQPPAQAEPDAPEADSGQGAAESGPADDDTMTTEAISYVYTMPALPENASLEQRNLGFDHTSPILGALSSTFGWREHPIEGGNKFHYGVDLAADDGADICAFADGTVYATGESSTLGNYIMLQHEGGYITLYAHCSRVTATGGSVSMGDKIAEVGSTGAATGPHLHFELHDGDLYLNPIYYVEVG